MRVFAFDPGWQEICYSEWFKCALVGHEKVPRMKDYGEYLGRLISLAEVADTFVIEDQHAGIHGILASRLPTYQKIKIVGSMVNSTIKIVKAATEILIYGVQHDVEIHEVHASSWQAMFKNNEIKKTFGLNSVPSNTKEASKLFAKQIAEEVVKNNNLADAICLGYKWHYDQGLIKLG